MRSDRRLLANEGGGVERAGSVATCVFACVMSHVHAASARQSHIRPASLLGLSIVQV